MRPGSRATPLLAPFSLAPPLLVAALLASAGAAERTRPVVAAAGERTAPATAGAATPAILGALTVTIDRAKVIRLPEQAQTVVLGNPAIADISVQKNGVAILTGKSYGVTNVIALDASGTMLAESIVSVSAPNDSLVTVQRGLERQSLSCTPSCQPSVVLGDARGYFSETTGQADQHRAFSTQK